jgi:dTMP kinase
MGKIDPLVELLLYEAARTALVSQVIRPGLKAGKLCIIDQFQDSTWVYQGWAGRVDLKVVEAIGRAATGGLKPDLTILLDLPVEQGLKRVQRPNRMEAKPLFFHRKVRQGYRALARRNRRRFRVIRAGRPFKEVRERIQKAVHDVI